MASLVTPTKSFALMVLLGGLPLLVLVLLIARGMHDDSLALEAKRREQLTGLADRFGGQLAADLRKLGRDQMLLVEGPVLSGENYRDALRNLVTRGTPELAVIYDDGSRVYPPQDSVASTPGETFLFSRLASQLGELRALAQRNGDAWRWVYRDGTRGLAYCKSLTITAELACVVVSAELTQAALSGSVANFASTQPHTAVSLFDATGRNVAGTEGERDAATANAISLERALSGVMAGWTLKLADLRSDQAGAQLWRSPLLIGGLPVCAFWALLVWHLYQRHRSQLATSEARVALAGYLSHDLRTPLANVRLYTDLIRREAAGSAGIQAKTEVIEQELARLDDIASKAVALARSGSLPSQDSSFAPDEVIGNLLGTLQPQLDRIGSSVSFDGNATRFRMDQSAFERVVSNLLDNARKFAAGSRVAIATWQTEDDLTLTVRDYGPGAQGTSDSARGSGLGLESVRSLIAENGGSLSLEEAHPGLRVTVCFRRQRQRLA